MSETRPPLAERLKKALNEALQYARGERKLETKTILTTEDKEKPTDGRPSS